MGVSQDSLEECKVQSNQIIYAGSWNFKTYKVSVEILYSILEETGSNYIWGGGGESKCVMIILILVF